MRFIKLGSVLFFISGWTVAGAGVALLFPGSPRGDKYWGFRCLCRQGSLSSDLQVSQPSPEALRVELDECACLSCGNRTPQPEQHCRAQLRLPSGHWRNRLAQVPKHQGYKDIGTPRPLHHAITGLRELRHFYEDSIKKVRTNLGVSVPRKLVRRIQSKGSGTD